MKKQVSNTKQMTVAAAMWLSALLLTLAFATGLLGPFGEALEAVFGGLLGVAAWAVVVELIYEGVVIARGKNFSAFRAFGDLVILAVFASFAHLAASAGGLIGEAIGDAARAGLTGAGAAIVGLGLIAVVVAERVNLGSLVSRAKEVMAPSSSSGSSGSRVREAAPSIRVVAPKVTEMPMPNVDAYAAEPSLESSDTIASPMRFEAQIASPAIAVQSHKVSSVVTKFALPSTGLLAKAVMGVSVDSAQLQQEGELLVSTLQAYDIDVQLEEIVTGPSTATFECTMARGTKLSKVMGLADDLSLVFSRKVRVVASRMGRVGFEVAREKRATVGLRELIEDASFQSMTGLPVVIGRGVRGEAVFMDLADAPHLIVAGSTGSGKSVGINTLLLSLLYRCTPDELKLVLVDPKCVELLPFANLPHLLCPPVTDPTEAQSALAWCVAEMERRYQLLAKSSSKNIATFNVKASSSERLPFIVVVVDEAGDLMMQGGKEIESLLVRLGQKARASGIHVVLSTQRPSVDILTGLIKSNFPARIAYRTAQSVDSRIILDEVGAERLLGRGDALVRIGGDSLLRAQGPYVSEEEIAAVVGHWCAQSAPHYDESVLTQNDEVKPAKVSRKGAESMLS